MQDIKIKDKSPNCSKHVLQDVFSICLADLENEEWIDAIGFDGIYQVSNLGRIKSIGRYVPIRNGERWVKERILKQSLSKDGRLSCGFSIDNKKHSINVPYVIWQSFNYTKKINTKKECIMHKNKNQSDNRLINLEKTTISKSHSMNWEKGLLGHLKENNSKRTEIYNSLTERKCKCCNEVKSIKKYKRGCFTCRNCEYLKASADKIKYRQKKEILIKCISDKTILRFNNTIDIMNSGIISRPTFRKILKTGEKNFKSFKTKKEYLIVSVI